jgi:hypothetical protein
MPQHQTPNLTASQALTIVTCILTITAALLLLATITIH